MNDVKIGEKIRMLRIEQGLTQEELAGRCELSKGFISQLENDLTSPSISTLVDILECLGTSLNNFFSDDIEDKIVVRQEDMFEKEDTELGHFVYWLVPKAQKMSMQPILLRLEPGGESEVYDPFEGEEFGYVIRGSVTLFLGKRQFKVKKGDSFYFRASTSHYLKNTSKTPAEIIWVTSPPNF